MVALSLEQVTKYMGEDFSLDKITMDLHYGEVHGIIGENGSGKSLTIKIISGIYTKDSGSIVLDGQDISPSSVYEAKKLGIHPVLQEVALYPNFTVAENIFADNMPYKNKRIGSIDFNQLYYLCNRLFEELNINLNPRALVSSLGFAQRHLVEVIKAYVSDAKVIIFDEPSSAFTEVEKKILYHIILELKKKNKAIFYITHFIEELELIADRVSLFYQGKVLETRSMKESTMDEIILMMTRAINHKRYPKLDIPQGRVVLKVESLCFADILSDISFELRKGQILGLTGLIGSGRSVLAKCLFGELKPTSGKIIIDDKERKIRDPKDAIDCGIAYLAEDRINNSVFGCLNLRDNLSMSSLKRFQRNLIIDTPILSHVSSAYIEKLSIKPGHGDDIVNTYSGGNQQKMAMARWIMSRQKIYILDEPTRGVDIASKTDIYNCLIDMVRKGVSIILISSDIDEILGICDNIMVINEGRIMCNLPREIATKEAVITYASTTKKDSKVSTEQK